ncbi:MAG: response regulator transcription factor [Capsulimonadales bacterium]|nr:response regulator transcription factor [Capsulimonadales bacterium]
MDNRIRVALVDDHAMVRKGIRFFLETQNDIEIVGEASSGEEALTLTEEQTPDIVLMDLMMPGMGGIEAARRIKTISPNTRIIALTSSQEREHILPTMAAGAAAYVLKDVGPLDLALTVRRVAAGEVVIEPRIAAQLVRSLQKEEPSVGRRLSEDLTAREMEVLRLIAEGLSNAEIAQRLFLSEKTVKTHVSNILSKLQLADRTQAAIFAWKEGLVKEG